MPSKEALDLIDLLDENPRIALRVNWDVLGEKEPDLNISKIRSTYLENLSRQSAVGSQSITKEEYDRLNAPKEKLFARPADADLEAEKIRTIAIRSAIAEPATLGFPHRIEQPLDLAPVKLETEIPTPTVEPVSTATGIPVSPVEKARMKTMLAPARIGRPTDTIDLTKAEITEIQKRRESEFKTGDQLLASVLGYLPEKFIKFGTEQYDSMKLLAQLAMEPEIEIDGQKIPTYEVILQLPKAVGEHYLGYLKDPVGKITDDPFGALLDAVIIKGVARSLARGATKLAARPIKAPPAMFKGEIPLGRRVADAESIRRGLTVDEYYNLKSKVGAKKLKEQLTSTEELSNTVVEAIDKLQDYTSIPIAQRKGLTKATWANMSPSARLEFHGLPKEIKTLSLDAIVKKPEIITNPRIENQIMESAAKKVVELTKRGERGRGIIPTSEELTQAGLQLEKLNLYTNYVGTPLWENIKRLGRKIIPERIQRFFGENYGYPAEYVLAAQKNMTDMGLSVKKSTDWAKQVQKTVSSEDKMKILKSVTDPERMGIQKAAGTTYEPVVRQMQSDMVRLGSQAKDLGLIGEESFEFFTGRYLPKIHPEKSVVTVLPGKKMKFSGRLKQRGQIKEIPIEELGKWEADGWELFTDLGNGQAKIRQFVPYGTEQDPFVLWAKGISDLEHDIAIAKTIKFVADNKNWVSDIPKEGFTKLVKKGKALDDRFMRVSGIGNKYIHKEIAVDLRELIATKSDWRQFFDQMTSMWKIGKTAYNPATHSRNIVSNAILADMGGLSPIRRVDIYIESTKQFVNKGKYFSEAQEGGLFGKEFQHEINQMFREASNARNPITFWSKINKAYRQGAPARWYQGEEQFFKMAKFIHNRQKGMSVTDAVVDAHKWLFDYSTVSPFVNLGRRTFFPFITFQAKALPRIMETAIKHPLRIAKYWAAYEAYNRYSKTRLGLTDEQYQEIRENAPDYIRKGGMWLLAAERDDNGNYQFRNLTYFMPWGDMLSGGASGEGLFSGLPEPLRNILVPSHPIVRLPFELALNKSIFYERDIWRADENPWIKSAEYAAETLGPSIATQHAPRLYKKLIKGRPNYFGERESTSATLQGLIGARPVSVNVERTAFFNILDVEKKIEKLESRYFSTKRNQALTETERDEKLKGIKAQIDELEIEWKRLSKGPARKYRPKKIE